MTAVSKHSTQGFALVVVLWLLTAMIGLIGVGTAALRAELAAGQNRVLLTRGTWAARACLAIAKDRFTRDTTSVEMDRVALGRGSWCRVENDDTGLRVDLNLADSTTLARLVGPRRASALLDWRDADDVPRPGGAEAGWYRNRGRTPPRNGPFASVEEILYVAGFTPGDIGPLRELLGVRVGAVDINRAPPAVIAALSAFTPEDVAALLQQRAEGVPSVASITSGTGSIPWARGWIRRPSLS